MKRTLLWLATVVGFATAGSAGELSVFTTDSSTFVRNTFVTGETILLKVVGDTEGSDEIGIEGYLIWNGVLTTTLSATQGNWCPEKGVLFPADGFSGIFNQVCFGTPDVVVGTSVITLV